MHLFDSVCLKDIWKDHLSKRGCSINRKSGSILLWFPFIYSKFHHIFSFLWTILLTNQLFRPKFLGFESIHWGISVFFFWKNSILEIKWKNFIHFRDISKEINRNMNTYCPFASAASSGYCLTRFSNPSKALNKQTFHVIITIEFFVHFVFLRNIFFWKLYTYRSIISGKVLSL